MNPPLFAALCLLLFSVAGYAQPPAAPPNFAQQMLSPERQQSGKATEKAIVRAYWDGRGTGLMAMEGLQDPDFRAALGVSDEQFQQIDEVRMRATEILFRPKYQENLSAMRQAMQNPTDEATMKKLADEQEELESSMLNTMSETMDKALPPDLKQKMNETQLVCMGEIPLISPSMFEALDLTDAQKQQMEKIKKDFEPEFERHLESMVNGRMLLHNKMFTEYDKQGVYENSDGDVIKAKMQAARKTLEADPEYKRVSAEMHTLGEAFATKFKTQMFDVLTDEQWKRLQKLIDDPPEHAKNILAKMKKRRGESEKSGAYTPGPNSWQPGQPIPEEYRQQRNMGGRFPR
jgi:Ni/Co efflux regulator RcnB